MRKIELKIATILRHIGHLMIALVAVLGWTHVALGDGYVTRDGKPAAEIVIAEKPPRMVALAAQELQTHIEKMSGAKLPIVTAPTGGELSAIYVGRSRHTEQLKISDEGLHDGAFRMISGDHWLALIGSDTDFEPRGPWAKHSGHVAQALAEWDQITGTTWGSPVIDNLYRGHNNDKKLWAYDERGSLNAVYEFLRSQGVRWYMPSEIGQITPRKSTIAIPQINTVIRPAFGLRYHHVAVFAGASWDDILWYLRLGLNHSSKESGFAFIHSHGMTDVLSRAEMRQAHPEYYAVWGGKRMNGKEPKPCLSSEGLFQENVRYLRTLLDTYDLPMASLFPPDGYALLCECDLCKGKGTPERGQAGSMSDYVWGYVNRVAAEVYKTHPSKKISCFAYSSYVHPPLKIEKLSPNLVVGVLEPRSGFGDAEVRNKYVELRQAWQAKCNPENKLMVWQHYPFTAPGRPAYGVPHYFPHAIATDLRSLAGNSYGEHLELTFEPSRMFAVHGTAFSHLNIVLTAQMYWNPDLNVDAFLDDYFRTFYGPAAEEMRKFVAFCEANSQALYTHVPTMNQVFPLLAAAQEKAGTADASGEASIYRRRIDLLAEFLQPLKARAAQMSKGRDEAPIAWAGDVKNVVANLQLDGRLDEDVWKNLPEYKLRSLVTGREPAAGTSFKMCWIGDSLHLGIRCQDPDTKSLNIGTTRNGDQAIWLGDVVEILIQTQNHAYYQIALNPAAAQVNVDRINGVNFDWSSQAQVATKIEDGSWTVEVRIPVTDLDGGAIDPLHNVVGLKPTESKPWYFNVCRQRVRAADRELSAFSPTGEENFHVAHKFGKLIVR